MQDRQETVDIFDAALDLFFLLLLGDVIFQHRASDVIHKDILHGGLEVKIRSDEDFSETLNQVATLTKAKKANYLGLNSFVKLQTLFNLVGRRTAYNLLQRHLRNPNICITNIGILDDKRLLFGNAEIESAYITGSIKYRPHFQMSLSTHRDHMTFAVNLNGSKKDCEAIRDFFTAMDRELEAVTVA